MRRSRAQTSPPPRTESPPTCSCTTPICRAPVQHRMIHLHDDNDNDNDNDTLDVMSASTLVATALLLTPVTTLQAKSISTTPLRSLLVLNVQDSIETKKSRSRSMTWLNGFKRNRTTSVASSTSSSSSSSSSRS
ncbi:uncharacterized protein SEPMUDRAFT_149472 [Sphaerulina musiva SO2202]|uniref:Uncharacterized protein n=1 Tax=Sphaerulina musiva (strain SO2202) TaxID=692275 RepID=M3D4Z2_SPHMS|nr:uncharacterized protein SEPMUDRAFT_149472 [Sphaerulina musiva SO2202]EMF12939.1 hypothetical protein SEPMUDRAFT_149472 [Sphaerulina musiva SO2202]